MTVTVLLLLSAIELYYGIELRLVHPHTPPTSISTWPDCPEKLISVWYYDDLDVAGPKGVEGWSERENCYWVCWIELNGALTPWCCLVFWMLSICLFVCCLDCLSVLSCLSCILCCVETKKKKGKPCGKTFNPILRRGDRCHPEVSWGGGAGATTRS